ncbi:hypothetical protein [Aquimarina celericrescens]|uniref:Flavodoxin domain-containing protein n=1 Tax=Aquimarina celericrescens TaxID=1964542 RepID=A0ABW5AZP7_9FLAO|nr:hypothetical protein [Aquimarina celericrescens]
MERTKRMMVTLLIILVLTAIIWIVLSVVVSKTGSEKIAFIGEDGDYKALIVYDPDPIYNLDELISIAFAEGLTESRWESKIATVAAATKIKQPFDLYVLCANTYNWAPDKAIRNYIKGNKHLKGSKVVAITLGSGATIRSQRLLEELIIEKQAILIESKSFWLIKPNNESKTKRSNRKIAIEMANDFGKEIAKKLEN